MPTTYKLFTISTLSFHSHPTTRIRNFCCSSQPQKIRVTSTLSVFLNWICLTLLTAFLSSQQLGPGEPQDFQLHYISMVELLSKIFWRIWRDLTCHKYISHTKFHFCRWKNAPGNLSLSLTIQVGALSSKHLKSYSAQI